MRAITENIISMLLAVMGYLTNKISIWTTNVPLTDAFGRFSTIMTEIATLVQIAELDRKGIAEAKKGKENLMVNMAIKFINAIVPFANKNNNPELRSAVDYSRSELEKKRDTILSEVCTIIMTKGNDNIAELAPYGITATDVTAFGTVITNYREYITKPREGTSERKTANQQIVLKVREAKKILTDEIDYLVKGYSETEPVFVSEYNNVRIIVDLAGGRSEIEEGVLNPSETQNVFSDVTNEDRYKFENPGTTVIMFCRLTDVTKSCSSGQTVNPGETISITGAEMGTGDYLNVTNMDGGNAGSYRVERD